MDEEMQYALTRAFTWASIRSLDERNRGQDELSGHWIVVECLIEAVLWGLDDQPLDDEDRVLLKELGK